MDLTVDRWLTFTDERSDPDGGDPLRKVAVVAVIDNPCAGRYVADLRSSRPVSQSVSASP